MLGVFLMAFQAFMAKTTLCSEAVTSALLLADEPGLVRAVVLNVSLVKDLPQLIPGFTPWILCVINLQVMQTPIIGLRTAKGKGPQSTDHICEGWPLLTYYCSLSLSVVV